MPIIFVVDVLAHSSVPTLLFLLAGFAQDELTMDNISRSGLVNMCRYMGVPPFGNDNFLRYCLRSKLRAITQVRPHDTSSLSHVVNDNCDFGRFATM